jgi:hypothetical protein
MSRITELIARTPGPTNDRERIALCVGLANALARWEPTPTAHDVARGILAAMRSTPISQIEAFTDQDVDRLIGFVAACAGVEPKDLSAWFRRVTPAERMVALGRVLVFGSTPTAPAEGAAPPPITDAHQQHLSAGGCNASFLPNNLEADRLMCVHKMWHDGHHQFLVHGKLYTLCSDGNLRLAEEAGSA